MSVHGDFVQQADKDATRREAITNHGQVLLQTGNRIFPQHDWIAISQPELETIERDVEEVEEEDDSKAASSADGVVCPTWLHQDIQHDNLKPFLERSGVSSDGFVQKLSEVCGALDGAVAANYTGSWANNRPHKNDLRVLKALARWAVEEKDAGRSDNMTWQNFSKPNNGHAFARFVKSLMSNPTNISVSGTPRVLDYGCGSGADVVAMKEALNTAVEDTLCLDIFEIKRPEVTPHLLDASTPAAYRASLTQALVGNENSVHVAVSMVTFHHIPDPQMRQDALKFLRDVLHPGGIFLMAEWDNSVRPDRWIHYDLVHLLPNMLFSGNANYDEQDLVVGTKYHTVHNWISFAHESGLVYDASRSKSEDLDPVAQAAIPLNANRDFHVVFGKHGAPRPDRIAGVR